MPSRHIGEMPPLNVSDLDRLWLSRPGSLALALGALVGLLRPPADGSTMRLLVLVASASALVLAIALVHAGRPVNRGWATLPLLTVGAALTVSMIETIGREVPAVLGLLAITVGAYIEHFRTHA